MKSLFCAFSLMALCSGLASESITGRNGTYREICLKAATDTWYFQNFRSLPDYGSVLEFGCGGEFATFLLKNASSATLGKLDAFQRLEEFGNPSTNFFPGVGKFSGTTLRYIVIADQIKKLFSLPNDAKIVEIGAGFGGQSFILSQLQPFSKYYIYDLPEVEALIEKMMRELSVENVTCIPIESELPEKNVDLVISNYAFSECGRATQLEYFEKVIKKSQRGYMIYNQIAERYDLDYLSPPEFMNLLNQNGLRPKIYSEPIMTDLDNLLIIWDRTR